MRVDAQTDRQTDMTKLIVAFRNFANAPKNYKVRDINKIIKTKNKNITYTYSVHLLTFFFNYHGHFILYNF